MQVTIVTIVLRLASEPVFNANSDLEILNLAQIVFFIAVDGALIRENWNLWTLSYQHILKLESGEKECGSENDERDKSAWVSAHLLLPTNIKWGDIRSEHVKA